MYMPQIKTKKCSKLPKERFTRVNNALVRTIILVGEQNGPITIK